MKWRETHYALICDVLRGADLVGGSLDPQFAAITQRLLAVSFADALQHTNPRFDRARFIAAATGREA